MILFIHLRPFRKNSFHWHFNGTQKKSGETCGEKYFHSSFERKTFDNKKRKKKLKIFINFKAKQKKSRWWMGARDNRPPVLAFFAPPEIMEKFYRFPNFFPRQKFALCRFESYFRFWDFLWWKFKVFLEEIFLALITKLREKRKTLWREKLPSVVSWKKKCHYHESRKNPIVIYCLRVLGAFIR